MGRYFGIAAIDLIVNGEFGKMVSFRNGTITAVPLEEAVGKLTSPNNTFLFSLPGTAQEHGSRFTNWSSLTSSSSVDPKEEWP